MLIRSSLLGRRIEAVSSRDVRAVARALATHIGVPLRGDGADRT